MVTQTELIKYFSSIDNALRSSSGEKQHIIKSLRSDIEEYLAEFPEASFENLMSRFGTPDSIAKEYIQGLPVNEINTQMNSKRFIKRVILITCIVIVVSILAYFISIVLITEGQSSQRFYEGITTAVNLFITKEI